MDLLMNAAINRLTGDSSRELVRPSSFATTVDFKFVSPKMDSIFMIFI